MTFAVDDPRLGEEVAAAVVLRCAAATDERELRTSSRASSPLQGAAPDPRARRDPERPDGQGAAHRHGRAARSEDCRGQGGRPLPGRFLEDDLVAIWRSVLDDPDVGVNDDFFALGGDSILGAEAVARVRDLVGDPDLPLRLDRACPDTGGDGKRDLRRRRNWKWGRSHCNRREIARRSSSSTQPTATSSPSARWPGVSVPTSRSMPCAPVGSTTGGALQTSLVQMAADYVGAVRQVQPRGPYLLGGFCMGAPVVAEMALQLESAGEEVPMVILLDPARFRAPRGLRYRAWRVRRRARRLVRRTGEPRLSGRSASSDHTEFGGAGFRPDRVRPADRADSRGLRRAAVDRPATVVVSEEFCREVLPLWYLEEIVRRPWRWTQLPGAHSRLMLPPNVDAVAAEVRARSTRRPVAPRRDPGRRWSAPRRSPQRSAGEAAVWRLPAATEKPIEAVVSRYLGSTPQSVASSGRRRASRGSRGRLSPSTSPTAGTRRSSW